MTMTFTSTSLAGLLLGLSAAFVALPQVARPDQAAPAGNATSALAVSAGVDFELLLFGEPGDGDRLAADARPQVVFQVPAGRHLVITDLDGAAQGMALLRKRAGRVAQVAFATERGNVGTGQCSRSLVTGIVFEPGDELLLAPAGTPIEWASLRGRLLDR